MGVRLISPISGSLTVMITYMICKRILNRREQFYSVLFLGLSPSHILFSSVGYMESLFVLFVTISIYFLLRDNRLGKESVILSGLSLGLACLTRVTGFLLLGAILLYLFTCRKFQTLSTRVGLSAIFVCCVLVLSGPYYGKQLYESGDVVTIGRIFPPHEEVVSLDSLLYRVEIQEEISTYEIQKKNIHFVPWFRLVGTYYEFWGIWSGAVNVLFRGGILSLNPFVVLFGFTLATLYLTYFHIYGALTLGKIERSSLLHLSTVFVFFSFFAVVVSSTLAYGYVSDSMGYRKPLIAVAPILAIYAGCGMAKFLERIKKNGIFHWSIRLATLISVGMLLLAVCLEGIYMRERYETSLLEGANWIRENTNKEVVVLTSRSLEIAYLTRRRTMALLLLGPQTINEETLLQHGVSHILIPIKEFSQREDLNPFLERFSTLQQEGVLREVYRDTDVFILEVVPQVVR